MNMIVETRNVALWTAETIAEAVAELLLILDTDMRIMTANAAFSSIPRNTG